MDQILTLSVHFDEMFSLIRFFFDQILENSAELLYTVNQEMTLVTLKVASFMLVGTLKNVCSHGVLGMRPHRIWSVCVCFAIKV